MTLVGVTSPEGNSRRVRELLDTASFEVSPRDELAGDKLRGLLPPGSTVFVSHPPSAGYSDIVAACAGLRKAGFVPVPHIAARRLASMDDAVDFVRRATGDAGVDDVLLIGGDPDWPAGPFRDSLTLLIGGILECHGIERVRFAGYPEGHPHISTKALDTALDIKLRLAKERGLAASIITQFGFDPAPIEHWIADLRLRGVKCPVRVGIAGPASVASLARFAIRCGIGSSLRALARGHTAFARILTEVAPDALIDALAGGEINAGRIDGLHIFTFGGVAHTARWRQAKLD
jgi:methylenetetrahydrofolate reductase (NADPH)